MFHIPHLKNCRQINISSPDQSCGHTHHPRLSRIFLEIIVKSWELTILPPPHPHCTRCWRGPGRQTPPCPPLPAQGYHCHCRKQPRRPGADSSPLSRNYESLPTLWTGNDLPLAMLGASSVDMNERRPSRQWAQWRRWGRWWGGWAWWRAGRRRGHRHHPASGVRWS